MWIFVVHPTVVGGIDLSDAFQRFETMEFCARTLINGNTIGTPNYLTDAQIDEFENQIPRLLGEMEEVSYPSDERAIRVQIRKIVLRACDQGLMISSYGTVSVRWKGNDFLITPTNVARWDIQLKDVVQIKDGKREPGKIPSRSTWLHQEIYKRNPHINSIILTQMPYLMAYSVTGDMLLGTFDRLEVAEFSAKSLTMGASLGKLIPINDEQVDELRMKFLD